MYFRFHIALDCVRNRLTARSQVEEAVMEQAIMAARRHLTKVSGLLSQNDSSLFHLRHVNH